MRIAVVGAGEAGKHEASIWLRDNCGLRYELSTSEYAASFVCKAFERVGMFYASPRACWFDRRNHREFWRDEIERYNTPDSARMYREMAETHDVIDGLRKRRDLVACRAEGIVEVALYIERPGYVDSTLEIRPSDCDHVIRNDGTLAEFHAKLAAWVATIRTHAAVVLAAASPATSA